MANEQGQRLDFSPSIGTWASRSVTVGGEVHYAHEVNYFIWGAIHAMEAKKGGRATKSGARNWVWSYRRLALGDASQMYQGTGNDGSVAGRMAWSDAGWDYVMTGQFTPPSEFSLNSAEPNTGDFPSFTMFDVHMGSSGQYWLNYNDLQPFAM